MAYESTHLTPAQQHALGMVRYLAPGIDAGTGPQAEDGLSVRLVEEERLHGRFSPPSGPAYQWKTNTVYLPAVHPVTGEAATSRYDLFSQQNAAGAYFRRQMSEAYNLPESQLTKEHAQHYTALHELGHAIDMSQGSSAQRVFYSNEIQSVPMPFAQYKETQVEQAADWNARYAIQTWLRTASSQGYNIHDTELIGFAHGWTAERLARAQEQTPYDSGAHIPQTYASYQEQQQAAAMSAGLSPMNIPLPSASHFGNLLQTFRGMIANNLDTASPASRLGKEIGGAFAGNSDAWRVVGQMTGQNVIDVLGSNNERMTGGVGGVNFGYNLPNRTLSSAGDITAWQIHTYEGDNDTSQAALSAHVHALLSGASNYGVASVNRDAYRTAISGGYSHEQALLQPGVITGATQAPTNINDPAVQNELSKIRAMQSYIGMTPGLGERAAGLPQDVMQAHVDNQLRMMSQAIGDPSDEQQMFGMSIGQGLSNPQVRQALFLNNGRYSPGHASAPMPASSGGSASNIPPTHRSSMSGGMGMPPPPSSVPGSYSSPSGRMPGLSGGSSSSFNSDEYTPEMASLGNAVGGLSKVFDDAAKSAMRLTDSQSGYIKQADKLSEILGRGISSAQTAAAGGNQDAANFLREVQPGYDKLQSMLGGRDGLLARSMSDSFGRSIDDQTPDLEDIYATFRQRGSAGRKARSKAQAEGWYGDTGLEQAATQMLGHIAAAPENLLSAHFQLHALQSDIFGPMEGARQAYLQNQMGLAQQMAGMQTFGGYGFTGSAAYQSAFLPGVAEARGQLAFGAAAQRAYGGLAMAGTRLMGADGMADIQGLLTSTIGGAAAGGLGVSILGVAAPWGVAAGALGGASAYLAGGVLDFKSVPADRLRAAIGQQQGQFQPIANLELAGANAISAIEQKGLIGAITPGGGRTQTQDQINRTASVLADLNSKNPYRFSGAMLTMASNPVNAEAGIPALMSALSDQIGYLPPAQQQQIALSLANQYEQQDLDGVKTQAAALARAAANGLDIASPGGIAGQISNITTGASPFDVRAAGFSDAQTQVDTFLKGKDGILKAQALPGVVNRLQGDVNTLRAAGYGATISDAGVQNQVSDLVAAQSGTDKYGRIRSPQEIANSVNQYNQRAAMTSSLAQLTAATGQNQITSSYGTWAMGMASDTTPGGIRNLNRLMAAQGRLSDMNDFFQFGTGGGAGLGAAALEGTYMFQPGVAMAATQQAALLGYNSPLGMMHTSNALGRLMTAGVDTAGFTEFGRYGINTAGMIGQGIDSLNASLMRGTNYGNNLAQAGNLFAGWSNYGQQSQATANMLMGIAANPNQSQAQMQMAALGGNPIAMSMIAQREGGPLWANTVQTSGAYAGMPTMYSQVDAQQAAARQGFAQQQGLYQPGGQYSASQLAGMTDLQLSRATTTAQIDLRNFDFGMAQTQLTRQTQSTLADWNFQNQGIALSRQQQDYSYNLQGRQLGLQQQQMNYQYAYQQQQMGIDYQHQQTQLGWQLQNLQFSQSVNAVQFGFGMIQSQEDIRYSTGRQRRDAMRNQEEQVVMYSMQSGQNATEQSRVKQQEQWATDQFNRDKSYADQEQQFKQQNFNLDMENYTKQRQFVIEQRTLEDQQRAYDHQITMEQLQDQQTILTMHQQTQKTLDNLSGAQQTANALLNQWTTQQQYFAQVGPQASAAMANFAAQIANLAHVNYSPPASTYSAPVVTSHNTPTMSSPVNNTPTMSAPVNNTPTMTSHVSNTPTTGVSTSSVSSFNTSGSSSGYTAHGYAAGGFTGYGPSTEVAGVTHRGEYVIPSSGAPVLQSPEHIAVLKDILGILKQIQRGGNAIVNINQNNPSVARQQALSLLSKSYS